MTSPLWATRGRGRSTEGPLRQAIKKTRASARVFFVYAAIRNSAPRSTGAGGGCRWGRSRVERGAGHRSAGARGNRSRWLTSKRQGSSFSMVTPEDRPRLGEGEGGPWYRSHRCRVQPRRRRPPTRLIWGAKAKKQKPRHMGRGFGRSGRTRLRSATAGQRHSRGGRLLRLCDGRRKRASMSRERKIVSTQPE